MHVFLLAGCEVVLSAVVLAACNFLFIRKKSSTPTHILESVTLRDDPKAEVGCELGKMDDEEEKGAKEEQEKEARKEEETENVEEGRPECVTADSQELENFLKKPQQNGEMAGSPDTYL